MKSVLTLDFVRRRSGDEFADRSFGLLSQRRREPTGMQPRHDEVHKPRKRQFLRGYAEIFGLRSRQGSRVFQRIREHAVQLCGGWMRLLRLVLGRRLFFVFKRYGSYVTSSCHTAYRGSGVKCPKNPGSPKTLIFFLSSIVMTGPGRVRALV